ncbi:hypothetical protein JHK86_018863 [Glycine max]|nr:hypothetical protein JHK86_018863 [Glycine max]
MERLVAFACIEGIFFSGSYCVIFWLEKSCHASITIAMTSWWPHVARPYAGGIKGTYHPSWRIETEDVESYEAHGQKMSKFFFEMKTLSSERAMEERIRQAQRLFEASHFA